MQITEGYSHALQSDLIDCSLDGISAKFDKDKVDCDTLIFVDGISEGIFAGIAIYYVIALSSFEGMKGVLIDSIDLLC